MSACNEPCKLTTRYITTPVQTKRSGRSRLTSDAWPRSDIIRLSTTRITSNPVMIDAAMAARWVSIGMAE